MWRWLLSAALAVSIGAAAELKVVEPKISDSDGGAPTAASWEYTPGQVVYFTCRVSGFTMSPKREVKLSYTVQAFDPRGAAIAEPDKGSIQDEVATEDKNWLPKIDAALPLPGIVFPGQFKIVVKVEDLVAKASATLETPLLVHGPAVPASDKLVVTHFRFIRGEDDMHVLERAAFRPGDHVWVAFDLTGYKYGAGNHMDVTYLTELVAADGRSLWKQPDPAGEQGDSYYPKPYVSAEMGVTLDKTIQPGTYTLIVTSNDAVGKQIAVYRGEFAVE